MQKNKNLVDTMSQEYSATFKVHNSFKMQPRIQMGAIRQNKEEAFRALYDAGIVTLDAENSLAAVFGFSQIITGVLSGHLPDYLGEKKPRFHLRPLWLSSFEKFSPRRVIELGYNAIVLPMDILNEEMVAVRALCKDHGIKIIWAMENLHRQETIPTCPFDGKFKEYYQEYFHSKQDVSSDYIFWESKIGAPRFDHHPLAIEATILDLLIEELKFLEANVSQKSRLIYYLPIVKGHSHEKQAVWLKGLIENASPFTTISFSAYSGKNCDDHLNLHPLWSYLRNSVDPVGISLLPIINAGAVNTGEGLWPTPSIEAIDQVLARMERHRFVGAIAKSRKLPAGRGFLDCSLWITGQSLWQKATAHQFLETWLKAYRPGEDTSKCIEVIVEARTIAMEIRSMSEVSNNDNLKLHAESLLLRLRKLPTDVLKDYITFFKRDARRNIFYALQQKNIPTTSYQEVDDQEESFWTMGTKHFNEGLKITLNKAPAKSTNPSMMAILNEN